MSTLSQELASLSPQVVERLSARGFVAERLLAWANDLAAGRNQNRLQGSVEVAPANQIRTFNPDDTEALRLGTQAIAAGQLAVCVLAGGMATRMGGVVKALLDVRPGTRFVDLRIAELEQYPLAPPLWLMTSEATHGPIQASLQEHPSAIARAQTHCFEQQVSLRLQPDGRLFRGQDGEPSVYATGHGDLPDALGASGLLRNFNQRGGRWIWISNLDNLGASIHPAILGHHIKSEQPLSVELVAKQAGDTGGGPVLHNGRCVIAEQFRLPADFDASRVPVFNTNTFLVDSRALEALALTWTYLEVRKKVGGQTAIQFERLIGELSYALDTQMLCVPRAGQHNRFLPVKSRDDLARLEPEIERLCRQRGLGAAKVSVATDAN